MKALEEALKAAAATTAVQSVGLDWAKASDAAKEELRKSLKGGESVTQAV